MIASLNMLCDINQLKNSNVIIWGAGDTGRELMTKSFLLKHYNVNINFFVDKYKADQLMYNNLKIKKPNEIKKFNSPIIIASTAFNSEIYNEIIAMGIKKTRIIDSLFL